MSDDPDGMNRGSEAFVAGLEAYIDQMQDYHGVTDVDVYYALQRVQQRRQRETKPEAA